MFIKPPVITRKAQSSLDAAARVYRCVPNINNDLISNDNADLVRNEFEFNTNPHLKVRTLFISIFKSFRQVAYFYKQKPICCSVVAYFFGQNRTKSLKI